MAATGTAFWLSAKSTRITTGSRSATGSGRDAEPVGRATAGTVEQRNRAADEDRRAARRGPARAGSGRRQTRRKRAERRGGGEPRRGCVEPDGDARRMRPWSGRRRAAEASAAASRDTPNAARAAAVETDRRRRVGARLPDGAMRPSSHRRPSSSPAGGRAAIRCRPMRAEPAICRAEWELTGHTEARPAIRARRHCAAPRLPTADRRPPSRRRRSGVDRRCRAADESVARRRGRASRLARATTAPTAAPRRGGRDRRDARRRRGRGGRGGRAPSARAPDRGTTRSRR